MLSDGYDFANDLEDHQPADSPAAPPADPAPEADLSSAAAPQPMVVIQYRNRGLNMALLTPLLVLLSAVVIMSYQHQARLRPLPPRSGPTPSATPAGQGRIIIVGGSSTGVAIEPITGRNAPPSLPSPAPELASIAIPIPTPTISPAMTLPPAPVAEITPAPDRPAGPKPEEPLTRTDAPARQPLEPPAPLRSAAGEPLSPDSPELAFHLARAAPASGPEENPPEPRTSKAQVLQEIQAEAAQKQVEKKNLEREVALSKVREALEMVRKAQSERLVFHQDLRRLLRELGDGAGPEIKLLCERYGRNMHPEVEKKMTVDLRRIAASAKREIRFAMMRAYGAPEPMLLDDLARELDHLRNQRGGPRTANEVRVRAAKLLLKIPPPPPEPERPVPTASASPTTVARTPPAALERPVRPPQ